MAFTMALPIAAADFHGYLAYVSQLGNEDLVSDYIFTSQRESHSLPDMVFLLTLNYHSGLSLQPYFHKGSA